jgi:hypothetical protein
MTSTARPLARVGAGLLICLSLASCGSSGDAVSSSRSLDELGGQLARDGEAAGRFLAGASSATLTPASDDGTEDVTCDGGTRRTYSASFTASTSVAGGDRAAEDIRNSAGLAAQVAFERSGYELSGDVDKSSSKLPATLEFANDPETPDQGRTFRTSVKVDGDEFTTTIAGETACIAD